MPKSQASCSSNSRRRSTKFCKFIPFIHTNTSRQVCFLKGISYKELYKATDGFRRIMTCDSQSITYEAKFEDGSASIVKEVRSVDRSNEVFDKELQCLGRLHHRHVVALRGFSIGRRSFLIFENTAKGSLKEHLNDPLKTPLSWKTRVQIAIGVAAALLSNISCLCSEEKADMIPQFGALLLELITGQSLAKESADVIQWIQELRSNLSMHNMIDPDLGNSYSSKELWDLLSVARLCMKVQNTQAFSISQIFWYLQKRFGNN
ncbi:probable receptor-like protein kinase At1g49730 isoform X3 [Beta vulgaris subsp. vulgaris]|uniref:probable receptor-like protein kinase At1g49730 isoform X3 n=1 Tax=Beta vulgaris subsp. vulgaris TaxID=3555 RepID=UPI00054035B4|nr:probable receptor-like protein kinase At1g49730 isoform X3 [Beta vulgaris subsp. vulgaris]